MRTKAKVAETPLPEIAAAITSEGQEDRMISYAHKLSEERMRNGTASSQEIVYWLKVGSKKERQERQKLEEEIKLLKAKTEAIKSAQERNELYSQVIDAIRTYTPHTENEF